MSEEQALSIIPRTKRLLQDLMARHAIGDYEELRAEVMHNGSIDDRRKLLELQVRVVGLEVDKKADPFSHLPVFNFVFHQAGAPGTLVPPEPKPIEVVEDITPREIQPAPYPEPVDMGDLLGMVADLDEPEPRENHD